ncbi:MAG: biotin/lipoyl-binding protein, partial [Thermodesulfobacteriota bacterium]|nr:biotin/lipoyl-binding protein [Thermodesulfobacteriota bacterium]
MPLGPGAARAWTLNIHKFKRWLMAESEKANNSRKKTVILTVLVLFAAAWFSYWLWSRNRETTDDAFVDGRVFIVTPRVNGFVSEILVSDNQKVKEGEVLVLMDPVEYEVALAEAQAGLTEAEATLASFELNVPLEL